MKVIERKISELIPADYNPRQLSDKQYKDIKKSLKKFGFVDPVIVNTHPERLNVIIGGHQRCKVWADLGNDTVPTVELFLSIKDEQELNIRLNKNTGEFDFDMLANLFETDDLLSWGFEDWEFGIEPEKGGGSDKGADGSLAEKFVVPPFSILDTRQGYWQERKRTWREKIGDFGESRNDTLITSPEMKYSGLYIKTRKKREELGLSFAEYLEKHVSEEEKAKEENKVLSQGVSLLDPVLSELVVRWFGLEGGNAFDCFAGDTIFGWVAGYLGQHFTGIELRKEQADINNERVKGANLTAKYICDDGQNVSKHIAPKSQDLFFSCPPYFDLEVYSELKNDASNQKTYKDFLTILSNAFNASIECLKDDRFAVVVIGDVRDEKGCYRGLPGDVKKIFNDAGMSLYNEMILVESIGSARLRAKKNMYSRKVTKTHQNVLVFYKGNTKEIKNVYPEIEVNDESTDLES